MIRKDLKKKGRELKGLEVEEISLVSSPANRKSFLFYKALGDGAGVGGERQGIGGAKYCVCPKCGEVIEHKRVGQGESVPCQKIKCPKCGVLMVGSNTKTIKGGEKKMNLEDLKNKITDLRKKIEDFSSEEPPTEESIELISKSFDKIDEEIEKNDADDLKILELIKDYASLIGEFRKQLAAPWKAVLGALSKEKDIDKIKEGIKKLLAGEYGAGYPSPKRKDGEELEKKEKDLEKREEKVQKTEEEVEKLTKSLKEISEKIITKDEIKGMIDSAIKGN